MSKIENIYITQSEDNTAPPSYDVLSVGVVGDDVYLEIGSFDEDYTKRTFEVKEFVAVPLRELLTVLNALKALDDA